MIRKTFFGLVALLCIVIISAQPAFAHVLISDDSKSIGSILHIMPDDDPIAGQPAGLYLDVQKDKINQNETTLIITNTATNTNVAVPIKVNGSLVTADYTFPNQGVYKLSYTISSDKIYAFHYSQRVSRGTSPDSNTKPDYPVANLILVGCVSAVLVLFVIAFNRRRDVTDYSKF